MKNKNNFSLKLLLAAFLAIPSLAMAQINFQVFGEGAATGLEVSATGTIQFNALDVVVTLSNTSPVTSDPSYISAFYILKPVDMDGTKVGSGTESLYNSANPPSNLSTPNSWELATAFNSGPGNIVSGWEGDPLSFDDYFGAHVSSGPPLPDDPAYNGNDPDNIWRTSNTATFTFSYMTLGLFNENKWRELSQDMPAIFIRWQSIGTAGDSAKGYGGGGRSFDPAVVPEPSEVALMAMLGLGGLLFARRRFAKKK